MTATEPATFDTSQIAKLLQCSERHVANLTRRGILPAPVRLGSLVRWDRETVLRWLAANTGGVNRGGKTVEVRG